MLSIRYLHPVPVWTWPTAALIAILWWAANVRYRTDLSKYDGPFLASFTNFWRLWQRLWYQDQTVFPSLVQYGRIIRIGPKTLLFNDPEAIRDIYMTHFSKVRMATLFILSSLFK